MTPTYELCHCAEGPGVTCGVAVQEGRAHLEEINVKKIISECCFSLNYSAP